MEEVKTIQIETPRLLLRPWKEDDAESLYKYARIPEVGMAAGWPPHTSVEHSREVIRTVFSAPETYAITLKGTDEPIGCIGILTGTNVHTETKNDGDVEIGYWIGTPYWGKGLATEAMRHLLERCFTTLHAPSVWCGHYEGNTASRRVMEKCGFHFHHAEHNRPTLSGDVRTECFTRLTNDEWKEQPKLIHSNKKAFLPLLLLADKQETMIDKYLERGDLFAMHKEGHLVATAVVTNEGQGTFELKNLAVNPNSQRKGYGKKMIEHLCTYYQPVCHTFIVGTGESPQTMNFYKNCGFIYSHRVHDFFTSHYNHPIIENGKLLTDMVYFKRFLQKQ